jgi:hypothetical protein
LWMWKGHVVRRLFSKGWGKLHPSQTHA